MSGLADPVERRFDRSDLNALRLENLPFLLGGLYLISLTATIAAFNAGAAESVWLIGIAITVATVGIAAVASRNATAGAVGLVLTLIVGWAVMFWNWPTESAANAPMLVVGVTGILFGARVTLGVVGLTAAISLAGQTAGYLDVGSAVEAVVAGCLGFCLSWLTARPTARALEWAWASYEDARAQRDSLRQQQGELRRVSKSLAETCIALEQMNQELERARRAAEAARQEKAAFAAYISHELRTPLNLIIGFSEMMVLSPESFDGERIPQSYRGDVEAIYRNACHLSNLIDDILDLSQIEAHRMALKKEPAVLADIVGEAISAIETMFRDKRLTLETDIAADLPVLLVDRVRIRQVLINLLNNAARFTTVGGVTIRARREGDEVLVAVEDTGHGILPSEVSELFQDFHQAGNAPQGHRGSGLGLAICKRFIELHGGAIWATSTPGKGSIFSFTLPINANVVPSPLREDWQTWYQVGTPQDRPTVLVVGERTEAARLFQRYLDGFDVLGVRNLDEAAIAARQRRPGAVVISGAETIARLDNERIPARLADVPFLLCPLELASDRRLLDGAAAFLAKPLNRDQLRAAIRRCAPAARNILVVDDDPDTVRLLTRMLRSISRRYRIQCASSGDEALALLRDRQPDLILLDLVMPTLDGAGVLAAMQSSAHAAAIPVVIVTGKTRDEPIRAPFLGITRRNGLSVGEIMKCAEATVHALMGQDGATGQGPRAAPAA
ncbi:MAG: response regulator [Chloroflexi bacterium]|nr:response regulator [Chloroflexota bacterium]